MGDKNNLLKQIQICDLALLEAVLYLDTHKTDQEAIAYHRKHLAMAKEYKDEYVKKYGPLTTNDCNNDKVWDWVTTKWPWEYGSEV